MVWQRLFNLSNTGVAFLFLFTLLVFACDESKNSPTTQKVNVSFNSNGGTPVKIQTIEVGQRASRPTNSTKEGNTLMGWFLNADLINSFNFKSPITANITLYAKWAINAYTVTFHTGEDASSIDSASVDYNKKAGRPANPTRVGFVFGGWFTDNNSFQHVFNFDNTAIIENITLYAKWTSISYTVTFHTGEDASSIDSASIDYNKKAGRPANPTRAGFVFGGWFTDDNSFQHVFDFDNTAITENITLYAKWNTEPINEKTTVTEGEFIIVKLMVSQTPATDEILTGHFSTKNIINYVNPSDYKAEFEYRTDKINWQQENDKKTIRVPAGSNYVWVKIKTIDDDNMEVLKEEMKLSFTPPVGSLITTNFSNDTSTIDVGIEDNESQDRSGLKSANYEFMIFDVSKSTITMKGVIKKATSKRQKEIIDSLYTDIVEAFLQVYKTTPDDVKINELALNYYKATLTDRTITLGVYIPSLRWDRQNSFYRLSKVKMRLNAAYAFNKFSLSHKPLSRFNEDGKFGQTLIHEFGHALTLSDAADGGQLSYLFKTGNEENLCPAGTLVKPQGGSFSLCFKENSFSKNFIDTFYTNVNHSPSLRTDLVNPKVVSTYAGSSYKEDMAETCTAYVAVGNNMPVASDTEPAYKNKMALFETFTDMANFKKGVIDANVFVAKFNLLKSAGNGAPLQRSLGELFPDPKGCVQPVFE